MLNVIRNSRHLFKYIDSRRHEERCETYEIVCDPGDFGYSIYQISKVHQLKQLEDEGFRLLEVLDRDGCPTALESTDSDCNFFYYVCTKD
jgi:hypothetical protein